MTPCFCLNANYFYLNNNQSVCFDEKIQEQCLKNVFIAEKISLLSRKT